MRSKAVTVFAVVVLVELYAGFLSDSSAQAQKKSGGATVEFVGTITDAVGKPIKKGEVLVSFAGGSLGEFKKEFTDGKFEVGVKIPPAKLLPLMMKLTFLDDAREFPPRWIQHLSPRVPKNEK